MAGKPFDATPKGLIELSPADWPAFLGVTVNSVELVDADVSTVTAATDKVLLLHADEGDRIQHFDFQSGPDTSVPRRAHGYNSLLEERHGLPVESVVVLLSSEASLKSITGVYERRLPGEAEPYLRFRYRLLRFWQLSVEAVLRAGLSLLPLAPLSKVRKTELPGLIARMKQRLDGEDDQNLVQELWTATKVLMGLRYEAAFVEKLLQGVRAMKESTTYQAIVEEGRIEEARRLLVQLGESRFDGPPPDEIRAVLDAITTTEELERLFQRALQIDDWGTLLEAPTSRPTRRSPRKK